MENYNLTENYLLYTINTYTGDKILVGEALLAGVGCLRCKKLIVDFANYTFENTHIQCGTCNAKVNSENFLKLANFINLPLIDKITDDNAINWYYKVSINTKFTELPNYYAPINKNTIKQLREIYEYFERI